MSKVFSDTVVSLLLRHRTIPWAFVFPPNFPALIRKCCSHLPLWLNIHRSLYAHISFCLPVSRVLRSILSPSLPSQSYLLSLSCLMNDAFSVVVVVLITNFAKYFVKIPSHNSRCGLITSMFVCLLGDEVLYVYAAKWAGKKAKQKCFVY